MNAERGHHDPVLFTELKSQGSKTGSGMKSSIILRVG